MIGLVGKEIAEIVTPIACILAGIAVLFIVIRRWKRGIIAQDDLGEASEAAENRQKAEAGIKKRRDNLTDVFDTELSDGPDS